MESPRLQNETTGGGIRGRIPPEQGTECSQRDLLRLGPPSRRVCIKLLTRSNRRNLPHATWDRLVRLLLGRELDRLGALLRPLSVHVKSPDAVDDATLRRLTHLFKRDR